MSPPPATLNYGFVPHEGGEVQSGSGAVMAWGERRPAGWGGAGGRLGRGSLGGVQTVDVLESF